MSLEAPASLMDRVCYVQCNFCSTILAVSVSCSSSMCATVTGRCGNCANMVSVNMGTLHLPLQLQDLQQRQQQFSPLECDQINEEIVMSGGSTSNSSSFSKTMIKFGAFDHLSSSADHHHHHHHNHHNPLAPPIPPPEKRHRAPSAYNRFIKDEIQRIKANNPDISHREAFSTAAKNWAHIPHTQFGLKLDGNKQSRVLDHPQAAEHATKKIRSNASSFY